jgi:predicted phosphodiesterase
MFSDEIHDLSRPWRTAAQLAKLAAAPKSEGASFSFAVLGDVEPCRFRLLRWLFNRDCVFPRQMEAIAAQPVDFTMQLGDMVSTGTWRYYLDFFRQLAGFKVEKPYLTVIGNHDRSKPNGKSNSRLFRGLMGHRTNYSFDHAGTRFIVLDTSAKRVTKAQLKWLRMVLDTPARKLVFTHMPPVMLGLWGGAVAHGFGGFSKGAAEFVGLMSEFAVERVYMGHVHAFGVQDHRGVRYVLTGGGGSALFPSGSADVFHHYLTVHVGPDGVSETVHPLDGEPFPVPRGKVLIRTSNVSEPLPALLGYT